MINPLTWIIAQRFFRREALSLSLLSNCRYLQLNWRYLQIDSIWRYLQLICRYLQFNCRYLQFSLFWDISNCILDICKSIVDICNWIGDMCTSIGDICNSVNECENGTPYTAACSRRFRAHSHWKTWSLSRTGKKCAIPCTCVLGKRKEEQALNFMWWCSD